MKTKGLSSVIGIVQKISQFVVYLRAIIAAIEAVLRSSPSCVTRRRNVTVWQECSTQKV